MTDTTTQPSNVKTIYTDQNGVSVKTNFFKTPKEPAPGHFYAIVFADRIDVISFQDGPIKEVGVNGLTNEMLLAILIDRTKVLDDNFPCDENKRAIQHMEEALVNFEVRTARRMIRGVEGTDAA